MRGRWIVLAVGLLIPIASCAQPIAGVARPITPQTQKPPTAPNVDPRVGAVFIGDKSLHACTASVLDSPSGELIITAAHCMANGIDMFFVPGYDQQASDRDYWHVGAVYFDPRWLANQDPLADFAIARVSRDGGGSLESQIGVGGAQLGCRARTGMLRGYPSLPCAGFVDGTSGAPWIANALVTGVIGGLDGGGCQDDVSYSPPFDGAVKQLLARAEGGGPADNPPTAYVAEC
jgi:hypothetical protein